MHEQAAGARPRITNIDGVQNAAGLRVAIVASRFNAFIVDRLIEGAIDAEGLAAAHEVGVIHRDVKPDNILLPSTHAEDARPHKLRPKLVDFGVAYVAREGVARLTTAGGVVGTPEYMAPEAIRGVEPRERGDVWGLAITLYEAMAALFVAQAFGVDLHVVDYLTIISIATLASIGTAGTPGTGLMLLTLTLTAVGLPLEGVALIAGIAAAIAGAASGGSSGGIAGGAVAAVLVLQGSFACPADKAAPVIERLARCSFAGRWIALAGAAACGADAFRDDEHRHRPGRHRQRQAQRGAPRAGRSRCRRAQARTRHLAGRRAHQAGRKGLTWPSNTWCARTRHSASST